MPATRDAYPYLFYDVDRIGNSSSIRFVYFRFLEGRAVPAAESLLALLQRSYSDDFDFEDHFSLCAIEDARRHPWTFKNGGYAQGKEDEGEGIPRGMMVMCKNYASDASSSSEEEDTSAEDTSRGFLPEKFQNLPKVPPTILRQTTAFNGLPDQGLVEDQREGLPDDCSVADATLFPQDDDSLGDSTIKTTHTSGTAKQIRFEGIGDNEVQIGDEALDADNRTRAPQDYSNEDQFTIHTNEDEGSLEDDNETKAPTDVNQRDRMGPEDSDNISTLSIATGGTRLPTIANSKV